jgi:alpha-tubulin suppressor-like RCC1 family protein
MIPVNTLISKLNDVITAGGLSELELAQVFGAISSLENNGVSSVSVVGDLPPADNNKGRFVYITSEARYVFSNGVTWDIKNVLTPFDVNAYAWGANTSGQIGDNTTVSKSSPVPVVGVFTDWSQLSGGTNFSLGIRANGTAWAWGSNTSGRLGDNTTVSKNSPVSVVGGFSDWVQLSAGDSHSLGVRADGSAWAWGSNINGRLGDNTAVSKSSPVSVVGGFLNWVQLSAGTAHSLGLRANGSAWAWGANTSGRLGDNTTVSKSSPVSVVGGFSDWTQLSASDGHSLGVRANGSAWAWGVNSYGRLGDGTTTSRSSPVSVIGGFSDWVQLSAGKFHSLGVRANGIAYAWGANSAGRLGDNTLTSRSSPVSVVGGFSDWVQLSAGSAHSLGLRANGTAWAWGLNGSGRLGDDSITSRLSPVSVVGGFSDWTQLSAGYDFSLGVRS